MHNDLARGLSDAEVGRFIEDGFIRIDNAFAPELAAEARTILWRAMGLSPDEPSGWTRPVVRLGVFIDAPFLAAVNTPRLHAAFDALVGAGRWLRPAAVGTFPIRFPSPDDPGDAGWHVDMSFGLDDPDYMQWRINILSRGRALLMLLLFSDVGEMDAPTRIRVGSHQQIARRLLPHGPTGLTLAGLAANALAETESCHEALATGPAGTVYLCHPFLVHAAQPHRWTTPRFLAQPPLLPMGDFRADLPPSPVQLAIRKACGLPI
jgi:hypothetical protein